MLCLLLALAQRGLAEEMVNENRLKANYVLNFARLVEWPAAQLSGKEEFCIGSLGNSPLNRDLAALQGIKVQGRRVVYRHFTTASDATECLVLVVNRSESSRLASIRSALKNASVLTISDYDDFSRSGGMITIIRAGERLVFEVNLQEARRAGLHPGSQLLKLARKVYGRE